MRDFKKAIKSSIVVLIGFVTISFLILFFSNSYTYNEDARLRDELAGTIDYLIVGASNAEDAFYTKVLDENLGCNSYNLSFDSMRNHDKYYLLRQELERNDIKSVVLDVSYDTFSQSETSTHTDANIYSIMRIKPFFDRFNYLFRYVNNDNKLFVYSNWIEESLISIKNKLLSINPEISEEFRNSKGSHLQDSNNYELTIDEINQVSNKISFSKDEYIKDTIDGFIGLIELCKQHSVEITIVTVPVSDNCIFRYENLDDYSKVINKLCEEYNLEYYDFNLLINRKNTFSDVTCYSIDNKHMSKKGAEIFTKVFSELMNKKENEGSINEYFFDSYSNMKYDLYNSYLIK